MMDQQDRPLGLKFGLPLEVSQTLVQVAGLVDPSFKIEIKCIAVID